MFHCPLLLYFCRMTETNSYLIHTEYIQLFGRKEPWAVGWCLIPWTLPPLSSIPLPVCHWNSWKCHTLALMNKALAQLGFALCWQTILSQRLILFRNNRYKCLFLLAAYICFKRSILCCKLFTLSFEQNKMQTNCFKGVYLMVLKFLSFLILQ